MCYPCHCVYSRVLVATVNERNLSVSRVKIKVLYCTVLYCTVRYCTVPYCTVLYCTVLYCTVLYCTVLYCIVLYGIVLYRIVLYCTVLYCTVLYCNVCVTSAAWTAGPWVLDLVHAGQPGTLLGHTAHLSFLERVPGISLSTACNAVGGTRRLGFKRPLTAVRTRVGRCLSHLARAPGAGVGLGGPLLSVLVLPSIQHTH